jgi:hypothetical protein
MSEVIGVILGILFFCLMLGHRVNKGEVTHFPFYGDFKCKPVEEIEKGE